MSMQRCRHVCEPETKEAGGWDWGGRWLMDVFRLSPDHMLGFFHAEVRAPACMLWAHGSWTAACCSYAVPFTSHAAEGLPHPPHCSMAALTMQQL